MTSLVHHTHLLGIVALLAAALAAMLRRARRWTVIAAMLAVMAFVIVTDAGWIVHDAAAQVLVADGRYAGRATIQAALIAAATLVLAAALAPALARHKDPSWRAAWLATVALAGLFVVQTVSLHSVDAVLGRRVGPVMLVAWLWLAGGTAVVIAAWCGRRAPRRPSGQAPPR